MTPRQSEVATLVAQGWSNKQIARVLSISPATVKCHVHEILTKLGLERRSQVWLVIGRDKAA
jgi:DNA-binding NarL/FixJ family response regulator